MMLAERVRRIQPSGIRRIFELMATMEDPINLSIGQAHYDPPEALVEAACQALRDGFNRYTVTQGVPELNERIKAKIEAEHGHRPEASLVTGGVSGGLLLSFLSLLDPGDEILLPDPSFTMYRVLAELCGATVRWYDVYSGWQPDAAQLEELVSERTKIVLVNSPSNPTGGVLTSASVDALVRAASRVGAYIVTDEIYESFVYDGEYASPVGRYDRVIQLSGFSKTLGVPGWRIGYATGPADVLEAMKRLQQFSFVCAPAPFQVAVAAVGFDVDMSAHIAEYRQKRDRLVRELHPAFELVAPGGSFYAFPRVPGGDEQKFLDAALADKVLIVPGSAFSQRATHFRLSFAVTDAVLGRAIDALNALARRFT